jgi:outer membrane protein TolC
VIFPIYEDSNYTNEGGTAKLGVLFSLLRDRDIDKRRFGEIDARLALEQADLDVLLTRVGVQQRALNAYWRWVATGQQLAVYDNLLRIALQREQGLEREVDSGRRAAIFLTENRQNITRRQTLATAARRDFRIAANKLAFYLRGADGETAGPAHGAPAVLATARRTRRGAAGRKTGYCGDPGPATGAAHPAHRRRACACRRSPRRERAAAAPRPQSVELAEGFGSIGEGGVSRDGTDAVVGFTFSVPLERRQARGRITQAEAELESLRQEQRRLEDQVEIELRNILLELDVAQQLMGLRSRTWNSPRPCAAPSCGVSSRAPATSSSSISARKPRPTRVSDILRPCSAHASLVPTTMPRR